MAGSPGLFSARGNRETLGETVQFLIDIFYRRIGGNAVADMLLEFLLNRMFDDKNHPVKAGGQRVVNRIVNNEFTRGADRG